MHLLSYNVILKAESNATEKSQNLEQVRTPLQQVPSRVQFLLSRVSSAGDHSKCGSLNDRDRPKNLGDKK